MTSRNVEASLSVDVRAQIGAMHYEQNPCSTCSHDSCAECSEEMHEQAQTGNCEGYYPDPDVEVF